jgi:hypothetical protein
MSRFVVIDREKFVGAFVAAGFMPDTTQSGSELVFTRQHHLDPTMWVKVYSTLPLGAGQGRACGTDAIRCVLVFKNEKTGKSGGLFKATRVLRTGSTEAVIQRTLVRARECYANGVTRVTGRVPEIKS